MNIFIVITLVVVVIMTVIIVTQSFVSDTVWVS